MNKFSDMAEHKQLFDLREALYKAYDAGDESLVYHLSQSIDRLQLEHIGVPAETNAG